MSIKLKKNGRYLARIQLSTGERDANGQMKYRAVQETFDTKTEAENWQRKKKDSVKFKGAENLLGASDLAEFREAKAIARNEDLRAVAKFWLTHHPASDSLTCREVWEKYESSKAWANYAPKTQDNKRHGLKKFIAEFGDMAISSVTVEAFEAYLENQFDVVKTRNTNASTVKTMFKWAADRKQGYLPVNQLKFVEHEVEQYKEPTTLTVEQVKKLFDAAIKHVPGVVPFMALEFFAGIRTEELEKMDGADIDLKEKSIFIRAGVAKGKGRGKEAETARLLEELPDTVWQWLEACGYEGKLDRTNHKDRIRKAYIEAGIKEKGNMNKGEFHSVARHCFASYAYALYQDAGKVRKWTGHTGGDVIFKRHYAALKKKADGRAYFDILPEGTIIEPPKRNLAGATKSLSDQELLTVSKVMNDSQIARAYGVSPNAIKKRLGKLKK